MGQAMRRLGQTLRAAETKGATSYEVGTTVGAPVDQWVQVDIAGKVWPVYVPVAAWLIEPDRNRRRALAARAPFPELAAGFFEAPLKSNT